MSNENSSPAHTATPYVLPFYGYAALSLLASLVLLLVSVPDMQGHYFQPKLLGIIHLMALGWGTMMILGASHQLIPVLLEQPLFSNKLAMASFGLAATGIPILVSRFLQFQLDALAQAGGLMIVLAVLSFLINLHQTMQHSQTNNVHGSFMYAATLWLLATVVLGWLLLMNFTHNWLPHDSLHYLSLHAHLGIVGWFLMLVMGVGSRLLPMFLVVHLQEDKNLWRIFYLLNAALITFLLMHTGNVASQWLWMPWAGAVAALAMFATFIRKVYKQRLRKSTDIAMSLSLFSVMVMLLPALLLAAILLALRSNNTGDAIMLAKLYGFMLFFGWISTLIIGMTFKTLPFIVWNHHYGKSATRANQLNPADLVKQKPLVFLTGCYLAGLLLFSTGMISATLWLMHAAAFILLLAGCLYCWLVLQLIFHQPQRA